MKSIFINKLNKMVNIEGGDIEFYGTMRVGDGSVVKISKNKIHIEKDPLVILKSALNEGFDVVLIDSMAEVCTSIVDFHGGTMKNAETQVLNLLEKHNKAENQEKRNTTFLIIQQVTKAGELAGSNRFKHALTAVGHIKFEADGRCVWFSKNRRGGQMDKLFFSLDAGRNVSWLFTEPHNMTV